MSARLWRLKNILNAVVCLHGKREIRIKIKLYSEFYLHIFQMVCTNEVTDFNNNILIRVTGTRGIWYIYFYFNIIL